MTRRLLSELCSVATAPFAEHRVAAYVEQFARRRRKVKLSRDRFGNLLLELPAADRRRKLPRWVFTAHMDHPGFVAKQMQSDGTLLAEFHGYVLETFFAGQAVRFFDDAGEAVAKVIDAKPSKDRKGVPGSARLSVERPVEPGAPGMWDQGVGREQDGKFFSRVCDDLAGAAAALAMLDRLHTSPPASPIAVLLTRAEEEGFIGAIAASRRPKLLKRSDHLVAIECSAMQPYAPQGKGVIVRVGDRTSVFNSELTYFLTQEAEGLAKKDLAFQFQRALMPGGTCEATVYDAYGFKAASLCVPLGNYHNMDRDRDRIAPEFIDLNDWDSMVKLFLRVARNAHTFEPGMKALKARIEKRFNALQSRL